MKGGVGSCAPSSSTLREKNWVPLTPSQKITFLLLMVYKKAKRISKSSPDNGTPLN